MLASIIDLRAAGKPLQGGEFSPFDIDIALIDFVP